MENISRIISILLFLLMLCGLFYGVDKGIDITDEAFYVMGYAHQQEACYGMSEFQKMIPGFFPGNLGNLEMARYARLMGIFFSCAIFALSWSRYREKSPRSKEAADAFLWSAIFSFGTYMMGPPAISYNSFSSACILIIVSLGIGLIREKNLITLLSGMSMMGIFSAVLFYIKFSNALAGPATMLLLLILRERKDLNRNELKMMHSLFLHSSQVPCFGCSCASETVRPFSALRAIMSIFSIKWPNQVLTMECQELWNDTG